MNKKFFFFLNTKKKSNYFEGLALQKKDVTRIPGSGVVPFPCHRNYVDSNKFRVEILKICEQICFFYVIAAILRYDP